MGIFDDFVSNAVNNAGGGAASSSGSSSGSSPKIIEATDQAIAQKNGFELPDAKLLAAIEQRFAPKGVFSNALYDAVSAAMDRQISGIPPTPEAVRNNNLEKANNPELPDPNFGERAGRTVLGAVEGSAGDTVGAFANYYEGGVRGASAQREREVAELIQQQQRAMEAVNASLEKYHGDTSNANVQAAQRVLDDINMQIGVYQNIDDSSLYDFANDTYYKAADYLKGKSEQNIERAKQGLGAGGQFAVDLGVAATQMGLDALTMKGLGLGGVRGAKAAGGLLKYMRGAANVLPAMAVHSYGAGALQARAAGASYERQALFGLATAMKEVLTEKIGDMPKLAGGGWTDEIVNRALSKFIDSPIAKTAVRAVIGFGDEAFEEFIGGVVEPALESIYNDKSIKENYSELEISDLLYEALVGGVLGALGTGRAAVNGSFAADDARIRIQNAAQEAIAKQLPTAKSSSNRAKAEAIAKALSGEELSAAEQKQLDNSPVAQSVLAQMQSEGVSSQNPLYNTHAKRTDEKLAKAAANATDADFASYSDSDLIKIARAAQTSKDDALYQRVVAELQGRATEREAANAPEQRIDTTQDQADLAARLNPQLRELGDRNERPMPLQTTEFDENGMPIFDGQQQERAPMPEDVPPEHAPGELTDEQRALMQQPAEQPAPATQPEQPAPQPAQQQRGPSVPQNALLTVDDFIAQNSNKSTQEYIDAFHDAAAQNPELIEHLLSYPANYFASGRTKLGRALKTLKNEYENQQNSGTIGVSNTEEANNDGEQTIQQSAAGAAAGSVAGAPDSQALGRNASVSGGRSDSALQERGAGFRSPESVPGEGEGAGSSGASFLSSARVSNEPGLVGVVISRAAYDKDQREFEKTALDDGFDSVKIVDGDSFVLDGVEANGHVDGNGNLTIANLDPETRRQVKDHECVHLWSTAISDAQRLNALKAIALNITDRDTLNSLYLAYRSNVSDVYQNLSGNAFHAKVIEEIIGDMYGGMNRYGTNAGSYRAEARDAVRRAKLKINYLSTQRNNAIKKAWEGDTKYLKTRDLRSALSYTLDRLSPESKAKPSDERAADILLAYYDEGSDGTLNGMSKEQTKRAIAVMRSLLNELGSRNARLSDFAGSTTDYEDNFGLTQDRSSESFEGENGTVFTRKQKNKFIDLSQEAKSTSDSNSDSKDKRGEKTELQADYEYYKGDFARDVEAVKKTSKWEMEGAKGKMPKGANYLKGLVATRPEWNGWYPHEMPSQEDIDEARSIVEKSGENASIEEQYKLLDEHRRYLESVAAQMRSIRSGFYGSGNIEQRKADLAYIAENVKDQLAALDEDFDRIVNVISTASRETNTSEGVAALSLIRDYPTLSDQLNHQLDALRDEYRNLRRPDDAALSRIRDQITTISDEMDRLGSRLSKSKDSAEYLRKKAAEEERKAKLFKEAGDDFWAESHRRTANEFRVAAEKRARRENWAKRTLAQAEGFEERQPSNERFFVDTSYELGEREPLSLGDQALLEAHARGGDYVPSTKEPKIRNQQTEEANRIIQNAPGNISPNAQQQADINARSFEAAKANAELNDRLAAQIRKDFGLPPKPTPQRRVTDKDFKGFARTQERRYGNIGTWMSTDAWHNTPEGKEFVRYFGEDADESFNLSEGMRQGYADRYSDDEGKVSKSRGMKDPSGFRTSRSEGSFSTADVTFTKEQTEFRKKLDKIVKGEGELFKVTTENDNAPLHDETDDPRRKLTKEEREAQNRRVGRENSTAPVTQAVAEGMQNLKNDVDGILNSDAPLRHVLNLTESISSYTAEDHEMNWLTKNGIAETAQEIRDIFDDKNMGEQLKAKNMAEATTRLLQMVSTRVDRAEINRAMGLKLEESMGRNADTREAKIKLTKAGRKAAKYLDSMQLNPTTAFKMADGFDKSAGGTGYKVARMIENAVAREQMLTADMHRRYAELQGIEGMDDFVSGKSMSPVDVPVVGKITEQQAIEFIKAVKTLHAQKVGDETRLDTLKGFTFIDKNGKAVDASRADLKVSGGDNFANDMLNLATHLELRLSPAAKKYLEITDGILDDLGGHVSSAMQRTLGVGMTKYHKGDYYPVRYQSQGEKRTTTPKAPGGLFDPFTERTKTTGGMIRIESAADTVDAYIRNAVYAASYGELADTLQFLNTSALGLQGLSNAATDAFGAEYGRLFDHYVRDVAQTEVKERGGINELMYKTRQLLQQGALRFSVSVPIKQVASYWNAAGVVSPEALMQAYRFKATKAKGYGKDNLQLEYRKVGGIDPTLSEMLNNQGYLAELKKKSKIIDAWDKAITTMDYRTVDDLYHACIIDAKNSFPSIDQNSKEFANIVNGLFQEAVLSTQPTYNANARSEYQRTSNELIRAAGMFRTQQTQNYNRMVTAIGEYRANKGTLLEADAKSRLKQTIAGQMMAAVEFGALSILADILGRHKLKPYKKDEEEGGGLSLGKILGRLALNSFESIAGNVWFGNYAAQAIIDAVSGDSSITSGEFRGISFGVYTSAISAAQSANKAAHSIIKAIVDGDASEVDWNSVRYGITNSAQLGGIPANNIVNLASGIAMYVADGLNLASGGKIGNRAGYDDAIKMFDSWLKGNLKAEGAKRQAAIAFSKGNTENLLYNLAIMDSESDSDSSKAATWLTGKLKDAEAEEREYGRTLGTGERIANYLVQSGLSDKQIDSAIDAYAQSGSYNALYKAARRTGLDPQATVSALQEIDRADREDGEITHQDLKAYWHDHPSENKLVEALWNSKDFYNHFKDTSDWGKYYEPYKTVTSAGASPQKAESLVEGVKGEDGKISQKEFLEYYKAHPDDEAYLVALWDSMGYTNKGKPRTWESYKRQNRVK